jgi:hypothetical protein
VDFTKRTQAKDLNAPSTGRTHAPGKKVLPFERSLPPLLPQYQAICDEQIAGLRKKKPMAPNPPGASARTSAPTTAGASGTAGASEGNGTATKASTSAGANASTIPSASSGVSASKKARKAKKKKKKSEKARARKALEAKLDGYFVIEAPNGIIIEDAYGIPLIIIIRNVFPEGNFKSMNVSL